MRLLVRVEVRIRIKVGCRVWFGVKVKCSLQPLPDFWSLSCKNTLATKLHICPHIIYTQHRAHWAGSGSGRMTPLTGADKSRFCHNEDRAACRRSHILSSRHTKCCEKSHTVRHGRPVHIRGHTHTHPSIASLTDVLEDSDDLACVRRSPNSYTSLLCVYVCTMLLYTALCNKQCVTEA